MSTVHHQEYLDTVHTQYVFVVLVLLMSASAVLTRLADTNKYLLREYSVEILLMMDSGHVRNMYSTLSNKCEE